jgi:hypothetical protein
MLNAIVLGVEMKVGRHAVGIHRGRNFRIDTGITRR